LLGPVRVKETEEVKVRSLKKNTTQCLQGDITFFSVMKCETGFTFVRLILEETEDR
jgi:hypothetical protein